MISRDAITRALLLTATTGLLSACTQPQIIEGASMLDTLIPKIVDLKIIGVEPPAAAVTGSSATLSATFVPGAWLADEQPTLKALLWSRSAPNESGQLADATTITPTCTPSKATDAAAGTEVCKATIFSDDDGKHYYEWRYASATGVDEVVAPADGPGEYTVTSAATDGFEGRWRRRVKPGARLRAARAPPPPRAATSTRFRVRQRDGAGRVSGSAPTACARAGATRCMPPDTTSRRSRGCSDTRIWRSRYAASSTMPRPSGRDTRSSCCERVSCFGLIFPIMTGSAIRPIDAGSPEISWFPDTGF